MSDKSVKCVTLHIFCIPKSSLNSVFLSQLFLFYKLFFSSLIKLFFFLCILTKHYRKSKTDSHTSPLGILWQSIAIYNWKWNSGGCTRDRTSSECACWISMPPHFYNHEAKFWAISVKIAEVIVVIQTSINRWALREIFLPC